MQQKQFKNQNNNYMTKEEIDIAAKHSLNNKHEIEKSKMCGCYYCKRTFPASLIRHQDYTDGGRTALCPLCGIDAVIGDASGVPINKKVLTEISHVMFESESLAANVGSLIDGFAKVWNDDDKCGLVDKNGKVAIPCIWLDAERFSEGLAEVQNDEEKWGFVDTNGEIVIPCTWKYTEFFNEGLAAVVNDNVMWGFIDKNGQTVIPCIWNGAREFSEGLAPVMNDDRKWGFIDKNGENVIPCKWSDVEHFSEGLAVVVDENHKCGYINMEGKLVIPCKWEDANSFENGQARVEDDEWNECTIDKSGNIK